MFRHLRILFICKQRNNYGEFQQQGMSSGLTTSVRFVSDMLNHQGLPSRVVQVVDNNDIDREVDRFRPSHVFIEALWVVPDKFAVLASLHPGVKWVVRIHSDLPFLANEGVALGWIRDYLKQPNVGVAANSPRMFRELGFWLGLQCPGGLDGRVPYLPNYYGGLPQLKRPPCDRWVDIGCFGAIRPLKNQMIQAMAALMFAEKVGRGMRFHINIGRVEQRGDGALMNLRALFAGLDKYQLVEHPWMGHEDFLQVAADMDLGMQVSFSETFNIVTADLVMNDVPVVTSSEIGWVAPMFHVNPNDSLDIAQGLSRAWVQHSRGLHNSNKALLHGYNQRAKTAWMDYLTGL